MELGRLSRLKVRGMRPLVRALQQNAWLRRPLLARRAADLADGLDPDIAWMLEAGRLTGDSDLDTSSPRVARRKMAEGVLLAAWVPEGAVVTAELTVRGKTGPLRARSYVPAGLAAGSPGLVFVHGGGWVTGDLDTHDSLCRLLALEGKMRVVAIEPRLAPEHPFPAALDDTLEAFRDVARSAAGLGIDPARLGLGGDSAGGNLSASAGLELRDDTLRPALTLLIYPALDATCSSPSHRTRGQGYLLTNESVAWYLDQYVGPRADRRRDPRVSPLLAPDLHGAPRALVVVAGFDVLVDEAVAYAGRLTEASVPNELLRSPSMPHGFALLTAISRVAREDTLRFCRRAGEMLAEAAR